jgi:hypothetical protein
MMHDKKRFGFRLASVVSSCVLVAIVGASSAMAQDQLAKSDVAKKPRVVSGGRDPFTKYEAPRAVSKKGGGRVLFPTIQERIDRYRAQKVAAMNARMPAPKPTTALLLNEIQVVGISRTPRGYAAIVEATPIKLSYVIYPGEPFYDGQLVAIEDNRLIFRREIVFTDGRRERSVEMKPLRQASTVNAMSGGKPAGATDTETPAPKQDEKSVATAKP